MWDQYTKNHEIDIFCIEYGINIYPTHMKWKFGNMGPMSIQKHDMAI